MIDRLLDRITDLGYSLIRKVWTHPPRAFDTREKTAEIVSYLIFGGLTTLVSLISYFLLAQILQNALFTGPELQRRANVCQLFSWVCAVLFAFFTNKRWVFRSKKTGSEAFSELIRFFLARVISFLLIELGLFNLLLFALGADVVCKLIVTVLVVLFNYVASKLAVFRKGNDRITDRRER